MNLRTAVLFYGSQLTFILRTNGNTTLKNNVKLLIFINIIKVKVVGKKATARHSFSHGARKDLITNNI